MEKEYFIVVGDRREGPLSLAQLRDRGIEPSTLVWTAGMADWARADSVPELSSLLEEQVRVDEQESAFGGYARPEQPADRGYRQDSPGMNNRYGSYANNGNGGNGFVPAGGTNWKTLAIIATVVGFLFSWIGGIVGIFAILEANKAETAVRYGDDFTANSKWSNCKTLTIVSFVLSGIGLVANVTMISKMATMGGII